MVTTSLIHPEIIAALARCGHGSKILIADGNYPLAEKSGEAAKVFLGLRRGLPTVMDILSEICQFVNIEAAAVMVPEQGPEPEIFPEFRTALGPKVRLEEYARQEFYSLCMGKGSLVLAISTGEQRVYANIVLTIGCA